MHCDYHLHSEFSFDSTEKIENICKKAVEEGISEVAITDHAELPLCENAPWPDFERREEVVKNCSEQYENKLQIRKGVEIGQPWRSRELDKKITDLSSRVPEQLNGFRLSIESRLDKLQEQSDNRDKKIEERLEQAEKDIKYLGRDMVTKEMLYKETEGWRCEIQSLGNQLNRLPFEILKLTQGRKDEK